jgi:hypothetical protein
VEVRRAPRSTYHAGWGWRRASVIPLGKPYDRFPKMRRNRFNSIGQSIWVAGFPVRFDGVVYGGHYCGDIHGPSLVTL